MFPTKALGMGTQDCILSNPIEFMRNAFLHTGLGGGERGPTSCKILDSLSLQIPFVSLVLQPNA
jgi:hypothetical protein